MAAVSTWTPALSSTWMPPWCTPAAKVVQTES